MLHLHRFHVSEDTPESGEITLSGVEAHHARRVVRLRAGDRVALFDGAGRDFRGVVTETAKDVVRVAVESVQHVPPPAPALDLAMAWLHKDKALEEIVRRCTELGVGRFVFFRAARSGRAPRIPQKWRRLVIETCKQCGRLWLPNFDVCQTMTEAVEQAQGDRLVAAIDTPPAPLHQALTGGDATLLVGPEGDFTPGELAAALAADFQPVSLGPYTFRAEVAAVVAATLVRHYQGALGPVANHR